MGFCMNYADSRCPCFANVSDLQGKLHSGEIIRIIITTTCSRSETSCELCSFLQRVQLCGLFFSCLILKITTSGNFHATFKIAAFANKTKHRFREFYTCLGCETKTGVVRISVIFQDRWLSAGQSLSELCLCVEWLLYPCI